MRLKKVGKEMGKLPDLQMGPMVDCTFLLLIFFMVSNVLRTPPPFKIILPEGDFNIRMPSAAASRAAEPTETLPLTLVVTPAVLVNDTTALPAILA